jgi:hypothetical protein
VSLIFNCMNMQNLLQYVADFFFRLEKIYVKGCRDETCNLISFSNRAFYDITLKSKGNKSQRIIIAFII